MGSTPATHHHAGSAAIGNGRLHALGSYFSISHWDSFRSLSMPTSPGDLLRYNLLIWPNNFSLFISN